MRLAEGGFGIFSSNVATDHVDQHEMIFSAAGYDLVTTFDESFCHRLGVLHDLLLVGFELGFERFLERHCLGRDHVHERPALNAGKDDRLKFFLEFFARVGDDETAARTAQGLVRGRGHDVRVRHRIRIHASRDQSRDMRHVDEQIRANLVGNRAQTCPVHHLRIRAETADQHLRFVFERQPFDLVIIDASVLVHAVLHGMEQLAGNIHLGAVGEMPAMREAHAEDRIARLQQRQIHGLVGLRTRMRLHIRIRRAEQLLEPRDREFLGHIDIFAAAVITLARITLGVFVGQHAALCFHHARARVVFRGDQFDVIFLALALVRDGLGQFLVISGNTHIGSKHREFLGKRGLNV